MTVHKKNKLVAPMIIGGDLALRLIHKPEHMFVGTRADYIWIFTFFTLVLDQDNSTTGIGHPDRGRTHSEWNASESVNKVGTTLGAGPRAQRITSWHLAAG